MRNPAYYLAQTFYNLQLHLLNFPFKAPIVVYQMGKVGSKTIVESLSALKLGRPIYHVHSMTPEGLETVEKRRLARHQLYPVKHYWTGHYLRKHLARNRTMAYWHIISLVRDPIARNISAFFHALDIWYPEYYYQHKGQSKSTLFAEMVEIFLERYPHQKPITWFDSEMKQVFGIDVFCNQFPKSQGYQIYEGIKVKLLLIKLEDLNRCASTAFSEFLGIDQFALVKANIAREKEYGSLYKEFLEKVALPKAFLDGIYNSKYAQHFYSAEEITRFKIRWSKQTAGAVR